MGGSGGGGGGGGIVSGIANSTIGGLPIIGDYMKGQTAQHLANQQGQMAMAQLDQQNADRQQALSYAQPTDLQMQQLQQAVSTNTQDIQRKQKLLDSADPAFIEAGKQALAIMQGKDTPATAAALQPIQQQQAQQRAQLASRLQSQLGPGWEQSTAGQQAMAAFDAQSSSALNNARLNTLSGMMGYAGGAEQFGNLGQNINNSQNIINTQGNMQARQVSAIEGTPITMAGAPFLQGALSDQYAMGQMQGTSNTLGNLYGFANSGGKLNPFNGQQATGAQQSAGTTGATGSSGGGYSGGQNLLGNFTFSQAAGGGP